MKLNINSAKWKRHFLVPCALIDNYIKLADEASLKVLLCLLSSDDSLDSEAVMQKTGISQSQLEDAVAFWSQFGVIGAQDSAPVASSVHAVNNSEPTPNVISKVVHSSYSPKDITDILKENSDMKMLFEEAEKTLGRILKHYDRETLIILHDCYGFSAPSIILILEHCSRLGHTAAKYIESVAKSMFDKGIITYDQLEEEFKMLSEYHSFENEIKRALGISTKLTTKQAAYAKGWREAGYSIGLISLAGERCIDSTGKLAFPYIDKVLANWASKNITTVEEAENENNPSDTAKERSFDLNEFDDFTLGNYTQK